MKSTKKILFLTPIVLLLIPLTFNTQFVSASSSRVKVNRTTVKLFGQCFFDEAFAACHPKDKDILEELEKIRMLYSLPK